MCTSITVLVALLFDVLHASFVFVYDDFMFGRDQLYPLVSEKNGKSFCSFCGFNDLAQCNVFHRGAKT